MLNALISRFKSHSSVPSSEAGIDSDANPNSHFLVVGPPRGGFTLLLSVLNILYRTRGLQKDHVQETVNHFMPLAADYLDRTISNYFKQHVPEEDLFYSGEFKLLIGGPKWIYPEDPNLVCVRKYLGVRDKGDFTFNLFLPKFALGYDEVIHSHTAPATWINDPEFSDYQKFASIRNPIDIIHSSVYSINALTSEYIIRNVDRPEHDIRLDLAMNKLTGLHFVEGLITFLKRYLKEFALVKDSYNLMRWEDLIENPTATIKKIALQAGMSISDNFASQIWKEIEHRNLTRYHMHSFRKGVMGDWRNSLTNTHLKMFEEAGFNEYLEMFGYEKIKYFDEANYTSVQKRIEAFISKNEVCQEIGDDNLYTFAFNKSNFLSDKYNFKTYPKKGYFKIERSAFRDENMLMGFNDRLAEATTKVNNFLNIVRDFARTKQNDSQTDDDELEAVFKDLFKDELGDKDFAEASKAFERYRSNKIGSSIPRLLSSYERYNIVGLGRDYFGVPQSLGELDLLEADLSQYPQIIKSHSVAEVKRLIKSRKR